ncbi:pah4 homeobox protein encoded by the pah4 protein [Triangularia verruculosa]|uniref:Pah4 homeobox protein encoded by the pah4 protein n=1 Tax=Triangularia verruculosa TaxID=2587418 RepID=A0AAN7AXW5_9PEZI|nr:pah4 homeobox protein encoded by the pah4 protein [Triangularia verruculosa]
MDYQVSSPRASSPSPAPRSQSPIAWGDEQQPGSPTTASALPTIPQQSSPEYRQEFSRSVGENERHPKGKRKRTAAKDKAILEAAYNANPKPDKAARLDIVKRVSLNEKEVQIWFQNRRQNDRRKSRPLSPQELAALRYGGMQILSSDPAPYNASFSSDITTTSPVQPVSHPEQEPTSPAQPDRPVSQAGEEAEPIAEVPREAREWEEPQENAKELATPKPRPAHDQSSALSQSFSASVGYLSNRWNAGNSFTTPVNAGRDEPFSWVTPMMQPITVSPNPSYSLESFSSSCPPAFAAGSILPPPSTQSSRFRISMSLEGKAEVVASVISPPRPIAAPPTPDMLQSLRSIRRPNLQRSHSASPIVTLPPISVLTNSLTNHSPLPPRLTRGRSRDVHAWQFACDAENREDALTAQAKNESNGSAIAAISLLRSTSSTGGSPLQQQSSSAKRNATVSKATPRPGMAKKAKLGRASSSVARMQSALGLSEKVNFSNQQGVSTPSEKVKVYAQHSPSGHDSDKENWSPDEDGNPRTPYYSHAQSISGMSTTGRRPLPSSATRSEKDYRKHPRRTPGNNRVGLNDRANTAPVKGWGHRRDKRAAQESVLEIFEDDEAENRSPASSRAALDDEVERFMRGNVSPSKKSDVDAVAGLLSLSQGNWR